MQGNAAAPANDTQAKAGSEAPATNYTAQYTVYTQRGKSLADEVRVAVTQFIQQRLHVLVLCLALCWAEAGSQGKLEDAERLLLAALYMARKGWGESDAHYAAATANLANVCRLAGKHFKAEALYLEV